MRGSPTLAGQTLFLSVCYLYEEALWRRSVGFTVCVAQWEEQGADTAGVRGFRSIWENNAEDVNIST